MVNYIYWKTFPTHGQTNGIKVIQRKQAKLKLSSKIEEILFRRISNFNRFVNLLTDDGNLLFVDGEMIVEVFAAFDRAVLLAEAGRFVEGERYGATCDTWLTWKFKYNKILKT